MRQGAIKGGDGRQNVPRHGTLRDDDATRVSFVALRSFALALSNHGRISVNRACGFSPVVIFCL